MGNFVTDNQLNSCSITFVHFFGISFVTFVGLECVCPFCPLYHCFQSLFGISTLSWSPTKYNTALFPFKTFLIIAARTSNFKWWRRKWLKERVYQSMTMHCFERYYWLGCWSRLPLKNTRGVIIIHHWCFFHQSFFITLQSDAFSLCWVSAYFLLLVSVIHCFVLFTKGWKKTITMISWDIFFKCTRMILRRPRKL